MLSIRVANKEDICDIINLLAEVSLPYSDIPAPNQHFFIAETEGAIIASAAVEVYGKNAIFRSFAVEKNSRNRGIGKEIYEFAIAYAISVGIKSLYLLTTTASTWFENRNWEYYERDSVPGDIENAREFASICPSSARCMRQLL